MSLKRFIDRQPQGNPLFCELKIYQAGHLLAEKKTIYSPDDSDEQIIGSMVKSSKMKPDTLKIRILIEWINNKAVKY